MDEESVDAVLSNINFARGELVEDNYILAFKQMTEIAVKAMSPGVNDPGTAINAIDYLTELFSLRLQKRDSGVLVRDGKTPLKIATVDFEELLYYTMASLRRYCSSDPIIVQKLVRMLRYLKEHDCKEPHYKEVIARELEILLKAAEASLPSEIDKQRLSGPTA